MNNNYKLRIAAAILTAAALSGCGENSSVSTNGNVETDSSSFVSQSETSLESETESEITEETTLLSEESTSQDTETEITEEITEDTESTQAESEKTLIISYDNNLETYLYEVSEDGSYTFSHSGNDDVPWNVYILDEEFTDGIRYLYSNYEPDGVTEFTTDLKAGQYVYLICTENEWANSGGDFLDTSVSIYKN